MTTSTSVSDVIAQRVRGMRHLRQLSQEQLADRCRAIGAEGMTASVINNIELGRRHDDGRRRRYVTVEELFILAYALDVSPLYLMLAPHEVMNESPYPLLPGTKVPANRVETWLRGTEPMDGQDPREYFANRTPAGLSPVFPNIDELAAQVAARLRADRKES